MDALIRWLEQQHCSLAYLHFSNYNMLRSAHFVVNNGTAGVSHSLPVAICFCWYFGLWCLLMYLFWCLSLSLCLSDFLSIVKLLFFSPVLFSPSLSFSFRRPRVVVIVPYCMDMQSCCDTPTVEWLEKTNWKCPVNLD